MDTTADATDISAGNINVEVVSEAEVQLETEAADFDLNNFSLVAFVNVNGQELNPGTPQNYWSILGNAIYYGVTANTINKDAHMDTNFATKYLPAVVMLQLAHTREITEMPTMVVCM